jgi:hypothetical protein
VSAITTVTMMVVVVMVMLQHGTIDACKNTLFDVMTMVRG